MNQLTRSPLFVALVASALVGCSQVEESASKPAAATDGAMAQGVARKAYDDALGCLKQAQALYQASVRTGKVGLVRDAARVRAEYDRVVYDKALIAGTQASEFRIALMGGGDDIYDNDLLQRCSEEFGVSNDAS